MTQTETSETTDTNRNAQENDTSVCGTCGEPIVALVIRGPGEVYTAPCDHRANRKIVQTRVAPEGGSV